MSSRCGASARVPRSWAGALVATMMALSLVAPTPAEAVVELPAPSGGPWRGYVEFEQTGTYSHAYSTQWGSYWSECSWSYAIRLQTAGTQQVFDTYYSGELGMRTWGEGPYTYSQLAEGQCSEQVHDPEPNRPCNRAWHWGHIGGSASPIAPGNTGGMYLLVSRADPPGVGGIEEDQFSVGARWSWESAHHPNFTQDTCSESVPEADPLGSPKTGMQLCWLAWPHGIGDPASGTRVHGSWTSTTGDWPYGPDGDVPRSNVDCIQDGEDPATTWVNTYTWDFVYGFASDPDDPPPGDPPPDECEPLASGLEPCELEPGDILLWRSEGASKAQTQWADSYWTHAALYLGRKNLDGEPGFEFAIADALPPDKSGLLSSAEVAIRDLRYTGFADPLHPEGLQAVGVYRLDLPAGARLAAADHLWHHIAITGGGAANIAPIGGSVEWQSSYTYPLLAGIVPSPSALGPEEFYCSSLVAWAYAEVGYPIEGALTWDAWVDHLYITPDDLIDNQYGAQPVQVQSAFDQPGETFGMHSPAHVMLTDHLGRRTGKAPDGTVHDEIPGAWWVGAPGNEAVTSPPSRPDWTLTITGHDHGRYTLTHRVPDGTGSTPLVLDGVAAPGEVVTMTLADLAAKVALPGAERVSGPDRFATAVAVAQRMDPSDTVVLATGLDYPDALSAGPLAAATGAPLLLTLRGSVPDIVEAELDRRDPARIYLIGGLAAISAEVQQHLAGRYPSAQLVRLSGPDRYATSRAIGEAVRALPGASPGSFLVSGENFPDAVAVSALAAVTRTPIVLTPRARTHPETVAALAGATGSATVVGGTGAVAEEVVGAYRAAGATVANERLAGPDRFATSAEVAARFPFPAPSSGRSVRRVWLATGGNFPDALAAGPGAGQEAATLLLAPTGGLAPASRTYLSTLCADSLDRVVLTGGEAALSPTVAGQVTAYLRGACDT